ncbi:nitroreductase [Aminipila butyrica]|uniref:Nitroreductase n=1 Tax=Aminipila butyrica TaxID=433296 RepID=A0A858BXR3_9FIRM|nr:nitroreductase family protein [Aminipila butyrica]QIB68856.1 nitroreductase [Aminipila butyrica]
MDYKHAISVRYSCRSYLPQELPASAVERLKASIAEYNLLSGLHIQLIQNSDEAFGKLSKSYGMFSGVRHYLAMVGRSNGIHEKEKIGYYGEKLVLEATEYGLGTCWVAGTYNKEACVCQLEPREELYCVIAIGIPAPKTSFKDKLIKGMIRTKKKSLEELYEKHGPVPDWFLQGIETVQAAPSAMNKQPVKFSYKEAGPEALPTAHGWIISNKYGMEQIDLGIAKLHFEIGAADAEWEWED